MSVRIHSSSVRSGKGDASNAAHAWRRSAMDHAGSWRSAKKALKDSCVKPAVRGVAVWEEVTMLLVVIGETASSYYAA
jgi:hypothetical protein